MSRPTAKPKTEAVPVPRGTPAKNEYKFEYIPMLSDLCVQAIANNFQYKPDIQGLPAKYVETLEKLLPTELDLEVTAPLVTGEAYWKRCALDKDEWTNCDTSEHGGSWKHLFIEKTLQDVLEMFEPETMELSALMRLVQISKNWTFNLKIRQLLSHLDLSAVIFQQLCNLSSLDLTYGARDLKMDYEKSLFGMTFHDMVKLAKGLNETNSLTTLTLHRNKIDDDMCRMLSVGMQNNQTVTYLDLSHNHIADRGLRSLTQCLLDNSVLTDLRMASNELGMDAGKHLGRALAVNNSLLSLNLRLNAIQDLGGELLLEGLQQNETLTYLNMSSNQLGKLTCSALKTALQMGSGLQQIDLCNNDFGEQGGLLLLEGVGSASGGSRKVIEMDVRNSNVHENERTLLEQRCKQNKVAMKKQ